MKEEIIRMANEAGLYHFHDSEGQCTGITNARLVTQDKDRWDDRLVEMLAPFAALVAAAEREECAKAADEAHELMTSSFQGLAAAIRARGKEAPC